MTYEYESGEDGGTVLPGPRSWYERPDPHWHVLTIAHQPSGAALVSCTCGWKHWASMRGTDLPGIAVAQHRAEQQARPGYQQN